MGMIQKLFIFFIVLNSLVMFVGNAGMFGDDVSVGRASDYIMDLHEKTQEVTKGEASSSGINILEYFNPLNYKQVAAFLSLVVGFFTDPLFMFSALPAPFSYMFGFVFATLEGAALVGFIRGFSP